ncbi:MAG: hypothetical protein Q8R39_02385 [bacterium]|nr:hypothetical protein [bacterium]MDZ4284855.1 hypothetical protein [Patescibacteria group bacterium]
MNKQDSQPNTEDTLPPFPAHLERPAETKRGLTEDEADSELKEVAQAIETFARNAPPESELKSEPEKD